MSSRKRVLFISPQPFFEWRGSPIRVKFNVMALEQLGYEVDLLTLPIGQEEPAVKSRVIRAWNIFGSKQISIGPSLLKLWFDFILLIQGLGLVIRNRYDILHGTEETGFLCYILSFFCNAKCVYEKHSDSGSYSGGLLKKIILGAYNGVEKLTIKRSDLIICTGPGLEEQARDSSKSSNIVCIADIPSSIVEPTTEEIEKVRSELCGDEEKTLVTYVGSFAEYQGVSIIFEAIPSVVHSNNNVKFIIIGGDEAEISNYKSQLKEQGIVDSVIFLGKIAPDILPRYLAASDILLAPRKSGINSPLKILDYFKAGAAIVATNTIANKRLLNPENSMLCDFDVSSFSQSISELSEDSEKRQLLASNGHKLYQSTYNFTQFQKQLDNAYKSII